MIRTGNIEQLLNCPFLILCPEHTSLEGTQTLFYKSSLISPLILTISLPEKEKGANIQTLKVVHVLPLLLVISNSNISTFAALCASMELSFR